MYLVISMVHNLSTKLLVLYKHAARSMYSYFYCKVESYYYCLFIGHWYSFVIELLCPSPHTVSIFIPS